MRGQVLAVAILLVVFISGCVGSFYKGNGETRVSITSLTTDKPLYHSSERVNVSVSIYSSAPVDNVKVEVEGIGGRMREERHVDLKAGENTISFLYKLPRCNVCGGIREGNYRITCRVSYLNKTITNSTTIEVRQ